MKKKLMAMLLAAAMCLSLLPVGVLAEDAAADNSCGDGLTWVLEDSTLTISGTGAMYDYSIPEEEAEAPEDPEDSKESVAAAPWSAEAGTIHTVIFEAGITYIGSHAFYGCTALENVYIDKSGGRVSMDVGNELQSDAVAIHYGVWKATDAPPCPDSGLESFVCDDADCNAPLEREIPAAGHSAVIDAAVNPTTTAAGLTEGSHCAVCGAVLTAQEVLPPADAVICPDTTPVLAVKSVDISQTYTFTCTDEAKITAVYQGRDSEIQTGGSTVYTVYYAISMTEPGVHTVIAAGSINGSATFEVVVETDHIYAETAREDPTCKEEGSVTYTCINCGESYTEPLDALSASGTHTYNTDDDVILKEPTDTDPGEVLRTCTVCGETTIEEIPANVENPFTDVSYTDSYYRYIIWAVKHNITEGTTKTTFEPDSSCTRAQIVTFLWRAEGRPGHSEDVKNPFTDVPDGAYYMDAMLWAVENHIVEGMTETTFEPDLPCTRCQVVTMIWRIAGSPAPEDSGNPFFDIPAGSYYTNAVLWALENYVVKGESAITFAPDKPCTRVQIVTMLYRYEGDLDSEAEEDSEESASEDDPADAAGETDSSEDDAAGSAGETDSSENILTGNIDGDTARILTGNID